jgi:hypothetical protein
MSDKEIQKLIDLADDELQHPLSQQEALASLVAAGLLDQDGQPTAPYQELAQEQA